MIKISDIKLIIGAGLYGIYSAISLGKKGYDVVLLEYDNSAFERATYINQARIHMGYHYPRSISTAKKSSNYFDRFKEDYGFCIKDDFVKIYGISSKFSWTNASQFKKFCIDSMIDCEEIVSSKYFNPEMCEGSFITKEYTYDAQVLKEHLLKEVSKYTNVKIYYNTRIKEIIKNDNYFTISTEDGKRFNSSFVLNTTYASINQISQKFNLDLFDIKYELCEVIICSVSDNLKNIGITLMDGPFFSIMPFGKTGLHSLTSVSHTPHKLSEANLPTFSCQNNNPEYCSPNQLGNCNSCFHKPKTSWNYMYSLAKKYLAKDFEIEYKYSLFSVKTILKNSEVDDSRPTMIKQLSKDPTFISVLSGKINTVYDLDEILV